ncbi:hypothetical protein KIL84_015756 [Mauremys mutica]|uniref:Uncharacterized protein n=1 Tax=Mauremys mutica TaxID=74926 RepID=A0A9D3WMQ3_9SAUR|nr:hypothetical protein KIL84_015756 [Mauremys mutica]
MAAAPASLGTQWRERVEEPQHLLLHRARTKQGARSRQRGPAGRRQPETGHGHGEREALGRPSPKNEVVALTGWVRFWSPSGLKIRPKQASARFPPLAWGLGRGQGTGSAPAFGVQVGNISIKATGVTRQQNRHEWEENQALEIQGCAAGDRAGSLGEEEGPNGEVSSQPLLSRDGQCFSESPCRAEREPATAPGTPTQRH